MIGDEWMDQWMDLLVECVHVHEESLERMDWIN